MGIDTKFDSETQEIVLAIQQLATARTLDDVHLETLRKLSLAAEYRDGGTFEHTERVATTAALLAGQLGLDDDEVTLIRQAAPLHDIGKIAVSDAILLKPGRLTTDEFESVKMHAVAGAEILGCSDSEILTLASEIARTHHEWWDGSGYPAGLSGDAIPISGRIVALADVYDALTHERPYKHAWKPADAVAEIQRLTGFQFDPEVAAAFAELELDEFDRPVVMH